MCACVCVNMWVCVCVCVCIGRCPKRCDTHVYEEDFRSKKQV